MDRETAHPGQPMSGSDTMLLQARILAARLAAGRYARPIVFVSQRPSDMRATLVWIGQQLSNQGHDVVLVDDPTTAHVMITNAVAAVRDISIPSRAVVILLREINSLDRSVLAGWMDSLHSAAREGRPLGSIAAGTPKSVALLGSLRQFAETLIEFKPAPSS